MREGYDFSSDPRLIGTHFAEHNEHYYNAVVPPVFMNSLNTFQTMDAYFDADTEDPNTYVYGRVQNPTVRILEDKIAALEHGTRAYAFASGMAAAATAVMTVCRAGDHIVCIRNVYGPLKKFTNEYCREYFQMDVTFVMGDDIQEIEEAVTDRTALVILESPASIMMRLQDIRAVVGIAKKHGAMVYIDNTYCTPIFQNPLDLGVDIVMHTLSKYIGGHSDIIGGVLVAKDKKLLQKISHHRELYGGILGPMEAWLALRGLRTLEVRLRQHEKTAMAVAEFLEGHEKIACVHYPGLASFPQYELMKRQQRGNSGLMSFEIDGNVEQAKKLCELLQVFQIGVSWGGFESLAEVPYARMTEEETAWLGAQANVIRIHCGLEGEDILIADLEQALSQI
ncbi:MAG: trans-sulfuration enzyme family protein [Marvinbryantia sp.]|uniref:trans-sulfuration enzyme family protein n=1 Tax=Marvinbryantia sp. TaxID=2496532 RepID=UPI0025FE4C2B|nr:PLP-dependent aspartate aminotransferase family protein [uncultured Marvinbryantia sp.]